MTASTSSSRMMSSSSHSSVIYSWIGTLGLYLDNPVCIRVRGTPRRESSLEATHDDIELFRRAVDIQNRVFGIGREEQGEPVRADFDVGVVLSVRTRHMDDRQRNFDVMHCFWFNFCGDAVLRMQPALLYPYLWSKSSLVDSSCLFFRHTGVFRFLLLAHNLALGRFTFVQKDGLGVRRSREGLEPGRGHDESKC